MKYNTRRYSEYCKMKKDYGANLGAVVAGWFYAGWISYKSHFSFESLVANSLTSDHGEKRIVVKREDGKGVNCFWKN